MRLLLDNNLSPRLAPLLEAAGPDVAHVRDYDLAAAPDREVLSRARDEQQVLVSADTDFGTLLARTGDTAPSVIILRHIQGRRAAQIAALLTANLPHLETDLATDEGAQFRRGQHQPMTHRRWNHHTFVAVSYGVAAAQRGR